MFPCTRSQNEGTFRCSPTPLRGLVSVHFGSVWLCLAPFRSVSGLSRVRFGVLGVVGAGSGRGGFCKGKEYYYQEPRKGFFLEASFCKNVRLSWLWRSECQMHCWGQHSWVFFISLAVTPGTLQRTPLLKHPFLGSSRCCAQVQTKVHGAVTQDVIYLARQTPCKNGPLFALKGRRLTTDTSYLGEP